MLLEEIELTKARREKEYLILQTCAKELLFDVAVALQAKANGIQSFQLLRDTDLPHKKFRSSHALEQDVHLVLEFVSGMIFHLRACICHTLTYKRARTRNTVLLLPFTEVFLTAYRKTTAMLGEVGTHSLHQGEYPWDAGVIADEVIRQNSDIFT